MDRTMADQNQPQPEQNQPQISDAKAWMITAGVIGMNTSHNIDRFCPRSEECIP